MRWDTNRVDNRRVGVGIRPSWGPPMLDSSFRLTQVLRSILRQLDESREVDHNDPVMIDFRRTISKSIEELEMNGARAA